MASFSWRKALQLLEHAARGPGLRGGQVFQPREQGCAAADRVLLLRRRRSPAASAAASAFASAAWALPSESSLELGRRQLVAQVAPRILVEGFELGEVIDGRASARQGLAAEEERANVVELIVGDPGEAAPEEDEALVVQIGDERVEVHRHLGGEPVGAAADDARPEPRELRRRSGWPAGAGTRRERLVAAQVARELLVRRRAVEVRPVEVRRVERRPRLLPRLAVLGADLLAALRPARAQRAEAGRLGRVAARAHERRGIFHGGQLRRLPALAHRVSREVRTTEGVLVGERHRGEGRRLRDRIEGALGPHPPPEDPQALRPAPDGEARRAHRGGAPLPGVAGARAGARRS